MATDFGRDISAMTTLRTGRFSSGLRLVAEAAFRRLTTPTGLLRGGDDEANYGIDLLSLVGASGPTRIAATLPGRIRAELLKDDRVEDVQASVTVSQEGPSFALDITIQITTAAGTFDLVIGVDDVSVELLRISA